MVMTATLNLFLNGTSQAIAGKQRAWRMAARQKQGSGLSTQRETWIC
jgi:hypothetical protein